MARNSGHETLHDEENISLYTSATTSPLSQTWDSTGSCTNGLLQGNYWEPSFNVTNDASAYTTLHDRSPRSSCDGRSVENVTQTSPTNIPMMIAFEDETITPWDLEPRSTEEAIREAAAGDVLSIKITASGFLLVRVSCSETAVRLQRVKTLLGAAVQVTLSTWYSRNTAKIRGVPFYITNEQILDALVPCGVMAARRAISYMRLNNGECLESPKNTVMLTFAPNVVELPASVSLEGDEYSVEPSLQPRPQCMNCFGFEHRTFRCPAATRCKLCAGFHNHRKCTASIYRCVNCDGDHAATYALCPARGRFNEGQPAQDATASLCPLVGGACGQTPPAL